jgi:hypothetical protein
VERGRVLAAASPGRRAEVSLTEPAFTDRPAHNLPRQLTSFIGRDRELAMLPRMLWSSPLLTLVGPGGVGKTRLALRVAETVRPGYADGVWLVALDALADPHLVPQSVAVDPGRTRAARHPAGPGPR